MNQSTDITGATCSETAPHEAHPIVGSFRGSCSGINSDQWIADQVAQLSENELVLVKTVLDEIRAGRPVEHFMPGTKVYADSWGTAEFIVQGTAPWYDENGVAHRKVEIKSATGGLSGHVHPSELRRVPPYSPASACTCPLGPEDAHFPDCPWYVADEAASDVEGAKAVIRSIRRTVPAEDMLTRVRPVSPGASTEDAR